MSFLVNIIFTDKKYAKFSSCPQLPSYYSNDFFPYRSLLEEKATIPLLAKRLTNELFEHIVVRIQSYMTYSRNIESIELPC